MHGGNLKPEVYRYLIYNTVVTKIKWRRQAIYV